MYISTVDQFGGNDTGIGDRESRDLSLSVQKKTVTPIFEPGKISEEPSGPPKRAPGAPVGHGPPVEKRCIRSTLK